MSPIIEAPQTKPESRHGIKSIMDQCHAAARVDGSHQTGGTVVLPDNARARTHPPQYRFNPRMMLWIVLPAVNKEILSSQGARGDRPMASQFMSHRHRHTGPVSYDLPILQATGQ